MVTACCVQVEGGELYLACTADGRPADFTYTWEWDNTTLEDADEAATSGRLHLSLDRAGGRFGCVVNNSLGYGSPCHLVVEPQPGYLLTLSHTDALAAVLGTPILYSLLSGRICRLCEKKKGIFN